MLTFFFSVSALIIALVSFPFLAVLLTGFMSTTCFPQSCIMTSLFFRNWINWKGITRSDVTKWCFNLTFPTKEINVTNKKGLSGTVRITGKELHCARYERCELRYYFLRFPSSENYAYMNIRLSFYSEYSAPFWLTSPRSFEMTAIFCNRITSWHPLPK